MRNCRHVIDHSPLANGMYQKCVVCDAYYISRTVSRQALVERQKERYWAASKTDGDVRTTYTDLTFTHKGYKTVIYTT